MLRDFQYGLSHQHSSRQYQQCKDGVFCVNCIMHGDYGPAISEWQCTVAVGHTRSLSNIIGGIVVSSYLRQRPIKPDVITSALYSGDTMYNFRSYQLSTKFPMTFELFCKRRRYPRTRNDFLFPARTCGHCASAQASCPDFLRLSYATPVSEPRSFKVTVDPLFLVASPGHKEAWAYSNPPSIPGLETWLRNERKLLLPFFQFSYTTFSPLPHSREGGPSTFAPEWPLILSDHFFADPSRLTHGLQSLGCESSRRSYHKSGGVPVRTKSDQRK